MHEIRIDLHSNTTLKRTNEPITCGVPFPKGMLRDVNLLGLFDDAGHRILLQARVLDQWSDGSARWVLCDWQASATRYSLKLANPVPPPEQKFLRVDDKYSSVATGGLRFDWRVPAEAFLVVHPDSKNPSDEQALYLQAEDANGTRHFPEVLSSTVLESGQVRASVRITGRFQSNDQVPFLPFAATIHWFVGSPTIRCHFTIHNPSKAEHPGGLWDLGGHHDGFLKELSVRIGWEGNSQSNGVVNQSVDPATPLQPAELPFEIYQDSSGGANWRSSNHLNRNRVVPNTFQGYRLKAGETQQTGLRATPIVMLDQGDKHLALAMPNFWQNFPKAFEAASDSLTLSLFPRQYADLHELQGGEQKTHIFYASFGHDHVTEEPLAWTRDPLIPIVDPAWVASTGAIPSLTPRSHDAYQQLVDAAIEGANTFTAKREVIDEFGWRHFGEIYGDHEAVFHKGSTPLVSHYNNQYDAVAGFGVQFLRSGDVRWFTQMAELAAHVIDIDLYHTDHDKAAYNHGLFWHTYHYVDADTGTHRSYPKNGRVPPHNRPVPGGGPANEQNYAAGLMLHYFLTGDEASKEAARGLAQWVIDMDDGSKTIFRWLSRGPTGLASHSRTPDYHGPGRGSANSISVLVDGHRLTGERKFLDKAEQLIRRCIHPSDNVAGRNLLDAENRWFYTMFLQSLGKYLDHKCELGELDVNYAYARASLLHYARWMAEHEYPYLDKPELLEYPTETWAAQDMRKCEVFQYAAMHSEGTERERFRERAEFFFRYSVEKLLTMPTRTLCRPVVLMLSNGFSHAWHVEHPEEKAPPPAVAISDFGEPERFVPQKAVAMGRFKQGVLAGGVVGFMALVVIVLRWII